MTGDGEAVHGVWVAIMVHTNCERRVADKLKHDSVFVHRTDTAFVEHRIVKRVEVPRRRSWWDYTSYAALAILFVLLVRKVFNI
ncbi:MAG: hypothetical protein K6E45_02885 [Bacteroidaceae bacterium]|nr:hypothetical protein [Bacteroidaceae bacterium]